MRPEIQLTDEQRQRLDEIRARNGRHSQHRRTLTVRDLKVLLSERELAVLGLAADGLTDEEIGRRMFLSQWTIKSHVKHILAKLEARNRTHAVSVGYRFGLLPINEDT